MKLLVRNTSKLNQREERLVRILQALGDKTRFKMFKIMLADREMCVGEVADALGISAPAVSQHFRIFELVGLASKQRCGQKICYKLKPNDTLINQLTKLI